MNRVNVFDQECLNYEKRRLNYCAELIINDAVELYLTRNPLNKKTKLLYVAIF